VFVLFYDAYASKKYCEEKNYKYVCYKTKTTFTYFRSISSLVSEYESIKRYFDKTNIKIFVVPEGDAPLFELINLYSIKRQKKTICIQHGWSPIFHSGFRDMHYEKFLTWGKEFSEMLSVYNPKQKFLSTGSHILINKESNDKTNDEIVISFFLQAVVPLISEEDFQSLLDLILKIAKNNLDVRILVREHPSHPLKNSQKIKLEEESNIVFMNNDKYLLADVMTLSTISVSIFSSTLLEAMVYDSIPFIVNATGMEHYEPDLVSLGVGIEVFTFKEAYEQLNNLIENENRIASLKQNILKEKNMFFESYGEESILNIVKEINNSCVE
jgi:hypothetical protein